ncbi:MAG: large-conductance mechanosensitive channel protein MscL [Verrucomicrobia bacterium]|nr:large-conductance mechanosensitive channel protein MscL [Verrucomicrobiota bacterium]
MNIAKQFRDFVDKGNIMDLAVGVIIGASFGKVVTSLVNDVLMPPIGKLMGEVNFSDLFINLSPHQLLPNGDRIVSLAQAKTAGVPIIAYGQFISTFLDFIIVGVCVFAIVKSIALLKRRLNLDAAAVPQTGKEEKLLTEIRDLLKANRDQFGLSPQGRHEPDRKETGPE